MSTPEQLAETVCDGLGRGEALAAEHKREWIGPLQDSAIAFDSLLATLKEQTRRNETLTTNILDCNERSRNLAESLEEMRQERDAEVTCPKCGEIVFGFAPDFQLESMQARLKAAEREVERLNHEAGALEHEGRRLREAAGETLREYDLWAEDASDGEFAIWSRDNFMASFVRLRAALSGGKETSHDSLRAALTALREHLGSEDA